MSGKTACGNVLQLGEGGVGLERLRDVLGALSTDAVATKAASESHKNTSRGADSSKKGGRNIEEATH